MPTNRRSDSRFREVPMRRRPVVTILMLILAVILTLPTQGAAEALYPGAGQQHGAGRAGR